MNTRPRSIRRALTLTLHRLYGAHQPPNPRIEALTADLDQALYRGRVKRRLLRLAAGALLLAVGAGLASAHPGASGGIGDRILGREAADAAERIADFVRHGGGHLADGG